MEGAALPGRLNWRAATVVDLIDETPRVRSVVLDYPEWPGHQAGQHVDIRLTADDGYQAQRSYSIANAPEDAGLMLTVERLEDGEVSSYLFAEMRRGDALEIRGPIGGHFVWTEGLGGPLQLIAGGSGIVPLRSILRHRVAVGSDVPVRVLYSARSLDDVIYRDELAGIGHHAGVDIRYTLTRQQPSDWTGFRRRIDALMLKEVAWPIGARPLTYVCGPTGFVEAAASALVALGYDASRIRTEPFGPTG